MAARDVIEDPQPTVAPYGSWRSQIRIDDVVGDVVRLGEPWIDGDDIYWVEQRPTEAGRRVLRPAARLSTQMSVVCVCGSTLATATRVPSGEKAGWLYRPVSPMVAATFP